MKITATLIAAAFAYDLTWTDCGDADTHVKVTDLQPTSFDLGVKTTLTGSGTLDKDENGGTFNFVAKTGPIPVLKGSGNLCEDTTINFPLGAGSLTFHALDCPVKAGDLAITLDLEAISESSANAAELLDVSLTMDSDTGDKLVCMDIKVQTGSIYKEPPQGLIIKNATALKEELERNAQFEKEFLEGNYKSSLDVSYSMTNCDQICSNWCWATSATMCASVFGGGSSCTANEAKVAGHEFGLSCDSSCSASCNQGGTTDEIADGIKYLSGHSYSAGGVLSQSSLDSALKHGPVVLAVYWTPGSGGHAITISGGSGGNYHGHDPEGYSINTGYSGLTTYEPPYAAGSYVGKWGGTVYTNSGADVIV